jgi:hypothetical protein
MPFLNKFLANRFSAGLSPNFGNKNDRMGRAKPQGCLARMLQFRSSASRFRSEQNSFAGLNFLVQPAGGVVERRDVMGFPLKRANH